MQTELTDRYDTQSWIFFPQLSCGWMLGMLLFRMHLGNGGASGELPVKLRIISLEINKIKLTACVLRETR